MSDDLVAHSPNAQGAWHLLGEHLEAVGALAAQMSSVWGDPFWAALAGAWHDLGKARPGFQVYVRSNADAHIEGKVSGADKTHSAAGALHARAEFVRRLGTPAAAPLARALEYLIAGHHAGLADWHAADGQPSLAARLAHQTAEQEYAQAKLALTQHSVVLRELPDAPDLLRECKRLRDDPLPLSRALHLRMLFSALVDADFLDTEVHFDATRAAQRSAFPPLSYYASELRSHLQRLQSNVLAATSKSETVLAARAEVLAACRAGASLEPGVFTLTVPTGGGKTLSSLSFALEHAAHHGMRRVVYAIPYTSIIEQTASVFGAIFGPDHLIEHHSQAQVDDSQETTATRLAAENWDAPLVVTTNVQLFESLFANRPARCRKLHQLAGSVIVLDEAQMLPPEFLQPILDAMNVLLARYRISLVLCTATQPVLTTLPSSDARKGLRGLPVPRALIEAPATLFQRLRRTQIHWPEDLTTPIDLSAVADRLLAHRCALAIVNTRRDAMELARALPRESTLHLSAAMCGAHRNDVLATLRSRLTACHLAQGEALHVVSTQLIEAGVDVDFPVVFRALAGLDSIAQAAGRCNREGRLGDLGAVHVFVRPIPRTLGLLRCAAECTRSVLASGLDDPLAPEAFERYFALLYSRQNNLDAQRIGELLADRDNALEFSFRTAAERFKLIDDAGQESLVIPLHEILEGHDGLAPLLQRLANGETDRWLLRKLQRYTLNVHAHQFRALEHSGAVAALPGGSYRLVDLAMYDSRFGLLSDSAPLDAASLVQ